MRITIYNEYDPIRVKFGAKRGTFMKTTGIVRKVDELGRIVLPIELRRTLEIEERDSLEIYLDEDKIILSKYVPACLFCGSSEELVNYMGKNVCRVCAENLNK